MTRRLRLAAPALGALLLTAFATPALAAKPRVPKPRAPKPPALKAGAYEGADQAGRQVSFDVDRQGRIVNLVAPGPISCDGPYGGTTRSYFGSGPGPLRLTADRIDARWSFSTVDARLRGQALGGDTLRATLSAQRHGEADPEPGIAVLPNCAFSATFTAHRIAAPVAAPVLGRWSGTDALGETVAFTVRRSRTMTGEIVGPSVYGIWGADCPGVRPQRDGRMVAVAAAGMSGVGLDRSRATGRSVLEEDLDGPLGWALDGGQVSGWVVPDTGYRWHVRFDATLAGATASGTWRTVMSDAAGATLCDSGEVAWSARPGA